MSRTSSASCAGTFSRKKLFPNFLCRLQEVTIPKQRKNKGIVGTLATFGWARLAVISFYVFCAKQWYAASNTANEHISSKYTIFFNYLHEYKALSTKLLEHMFWIKLMIHPLSLPLILLGSQEELEPILTLNERQGTPWTRRQYLQRQTTIHTYIHTYS